MKKQKNVTLLISSAVTIIAAVCLILAWNFSNQWKRDHSGIPDAVSSRNENGNCFLTVVANSDEIEDKEAFARMVVEMCIQNSFESIHLSTDQRGYPERLEIKVYSSKSAVGKGKPLCLIRFEPPAEDDNSLKERSDIDGATEEPDGADNVDIPDTGQRIKEYNIKDDKEKYRLYVDGEEVEGICGSSAFAENE